MAIASTNAQMPPISSPTEYREQPFDVIHYDAEIIVPKHNSKTISGLCTMEVQWTQSVALPSLPFHLRGLIVDSVVDEGGSLLQFHEKGTPDLDTFHFRVDLKKPVIIGSLSHISIHYHGTMTNEGGSVPWGGVHYEDSVLYALGVGFNNKEISTTSYWMPCYDHPSDKASLTLRVHLPKTLDKMPWEGGLSAASIGIEQPLTREGQFNQFVWSEEHPTATYLYTFAIGPLRKLQFSSFDTIPVMVYSLARDTSASRKSYMLVPRMTELYSQLYGAFPFNKVGYVNTTRGAMEHQTLISFPLSVVNQRDTVNSTAAHELAHQWFGDLVTPQDFRHTWLTESFATYSEGAWLEEVKGWNAYLADHTSGIKKYIEKISKAEGVFPLYGYPHTSPSSNYPETIYRKGAIVLAMARALAGTAPFYTALKRYLTNHAYGNATTTNMQDAFRTALGNQTNAFFDEWVYGKGWPQLDITFQQNQNNWTAVLTQVQQQQHPDWPVFTTLPLNITYMHPIDGRLVDTVVVMDNSTLTVEIQSPQTFGINSGNKCRSLVQILNTTSVSTNDQGKATLKLRPQPSSNTATLEWYGIQVNAVRITGLDGNTVLHQTVSEQDSIVLDVSSWPSGVYQTNITTTNGKHFLMPIVVAR